MKFLKARGRISLPIVLAGFSSLAFAPTALAQSDAAARASSDEPVKMAQVSVSDIPLDREILPTARPFTSVFGMEDNIVDVPRNVTIISREQMDTIDIQNVQEFSKLTSSSYTGAEFGDPSEPMIRGQIADVFINGQRARISSSGNGIPLNFNSIESVNIIKGPATAVQGSTAYVGGFADLISKRPFFDAFHATLSGTVGSYDAKRWSLDVGGPISPRLAYRISYGGEDSGSYWWYDYKKTEAIYGALTWRPNDKYELFTFAQAYYASYREHFGINRPTQLLIHDGLYQSGINTNNGVGNPASDPENSVNIKGPNLSNAIAWGPLVPVNDHWSVEGLSSHDHGQEYDWQAIQTLNVSSDLKIINTTFWSYTKSDAYETYLFDSIVDPTWFAENRTEFLFKVPSFNDSTVNTGLVERIQHTVAYDNFNFEPVNAFDLSAPGGVPYLNAYASQYFLKTAPVVQVPGWPNRYAVPGVTNGDTNKTDENNVSPYLQATWRITKKVDLITGARADIMNVTSVDPLTAGHPGGTLSITERDTNASLLYKLNPTTSTYFTYDYGQDYTGANADGGGFGQLITVNGQRELNRAAFTAPAALYEAGFKSSLQDNHLFFTSAVYQQTRIVKPQGLPQQTVLARGFEMEANYQPNKYFYGTLGFTYNNSSLPANAFYGETYPTTQIPNGPPNIQQNVMQKTGRIRLPGQPREQVNGLIAYSMDNGFGISLDGVVTGPMNNDYYGFLTIPTQFQLDGSVFYKLARWTVRVEVNNITNQHNWMPMSQGGYGLQGITPMPGTECFITMRYKM